MIFVNLSSTLISQFVDVTNDKAKPTNETVVYGTTVVDGDNIYVKIDGSELLTPVSTTANVEDGERVTVMIKNHTATITGNVTSPSARGKDLEVTTTNLTIKIGDAEKVAGAANDAASSAQNAANSAQNTANAAQNTANNAANAADSAKRYATDYLNLSNSGLEIGASSLNTNVLISPNAIDFRHGDTILASYQSDYIYLGKANRKATIDIADGVARLYNEDNTDYDYSRLVIEADHSIQLSTAHALYNNVFYDNAYESGYSWMHLETTQPWAGGTNIDASFDIGATLSGQSYEFTQQIKSSEAGIDIKHEYSSSSVAQGSEISIGADITMYASNGVRIYNDVYLDNNMNLQGASTNGSYRQLIGCNTNNNIVVGYGGYTAGTGQTNLYGNKVYIGVKTTGTLYKPYYEAGDSVSAYWQGGGYISAGSARVFFTIPLAKPVIGNPSVSISSIDGVAVRQDNAYGYGGDSTNQYVKPSSYVAVLSGNGSYIRVTAYMPNTTAVTNNSACGVAANVNITFS